MMKKVIQYKILILVCILLTGMVANAQDYRKSKSESRSFHVDENAELKVVNKYGQIQLIPWDKDSIKISVQIEVRAKKESKAKSSLDNIEIDFVTFQSYVEAITTFITPGSVWGDLKDATGNLFAGESKTMVDYKIYLPPYTHLTIENKYGDVFMDEHLGTVNITLANGDLKVRALRGPSSLRMEFAYANIKELVNGSLNLDHRSEVRIEEANNLKIDSRSSRVRIEKVDYLNMKSYRDKYDIEEVGTVDANNAYTFLDIYTIEKYMSVDARYGNVDVSEVKETLKKFDFNVEDTDITIFKPENRSITIEAVYGEEAGLYFPSELINKQTTMEDDENKLVRTIGMIGESFDSPIKLNITMPEGNLRIK